MKITKALDIKKKMSTGHFIVDFEGKVIEITPSHGELFAEVDFLYNMTCGKTESDKEILFKNFLSSSTSDNFKTTFDIALTTGVATEVTAKPIPEPTVEEKLHRGLQNLINFFSEFNFEPNFRFINTLGHKLVKSQKSAKEFVTNYFSLIDNPYKNEINEKMRSSEFKTILTDLSAVKPTKIINERFKVYFGSAGTGKTTKAQKESEGRCVVCNATMLPSDLMEDFVFVDGNPSFQPSALWNCMTDGTAIVLDEINLLPFDSLRFLQGILDGKKEFDYKGHKVTIADGFQIIGTMNLTIGGMTYGLPEPLVDRCFEMKEFKLSADMLASAIM